MNRITLWRKDIVGEEFGFSVRMVGFDVSKTSRVVWCPEGDTHPIVIGQVALLWSVHQ